MRKNNKMNFFLELFIDVLKSIKLIDSRVRTELDVNKIIAFWQQTLREPESLLPNVFRAGISLRIIFEHKLP